MSAADTARDEARRWAAMTAWLDAMASTPMDPAPREAAVTGFDAVPDLARRAARWRHAFPDTDLAHLAAFAAGLAGAEAEAWESHDGSVATKAFDERRFLLMDRIIHWAVPWADTAGRCHPSTRPMAHRIRDELLHLGERLRPAPILSGSEGLHPPGEDSFGPLAGPPALLALGSGAVLFGVTVEAILGEPRGRRLAEPDLTRAARRDLATHYLNAAARWSTLERTHPGSARLWRDLARRAELTSRAVGLVPAGTSGA